MTILHTMVRRGAAYLAVTLLAGAFSGCAPYHMAKSEIERLAAEADAKLMADLELDRNAEEKRKKEAAVKAMEAQRAADARLAQVQAQERARQPAQTRPSSPASPPSSSSPPPAPASQRRATSAPAQAAPTPPTSVSTAPLPPPASSLASAAACRAYWVPLLVGGTWEGLSYEDSKDVYPIAASELIHWWRHTFESESVLTFDFDNRTIESHEASIPYEFGYGAESGCTLTYDSGYKGTIAIVTNVWRISALAGGVLALTAGHGGVLKSVRR